MEAVWRAVYDCLPPPTFAGSDLPCGGGGGGEFLLSKLPVAVQWDIIGRLTSKDAVRLSVISRYWFNFIFPDWLTKSSSATVREPQHLHVSSVERKDRISFLPDCLRRNIISRLPIRDAVRTKILSRQWCHDWGSTPLLLDDGHLLRMTEKQRVQRVSKILIAHPGPFRSIRLCFTCFDHRPDALRLWVSVLANKHVEDLVLVNRPMPVDVVLPMNIMRCTSLRRLYLGFFRIPSLAGHQGDAFRELRELGLHCVVIDSADLSHILRLSPMLESLSIVASYGLPDNICVHGHRNLHSIVLWLCVARELSINDSDALNRIILWSTHGTKMTVNIGHAQSLQLLGYLEPGIHNLVINNVVIQAGTKANPHIVVPSVKILACRLSFGDKKQSNMLPAFLRCFPHVETLHVQSVKANMPAGKFNLTTWLNKADGIECVDEHIKKLFFHQFHGERSEIAFLKFILMKAKSLEQMVIILSEECLDRVDDTQSKLIELGNSYRASEQPRLLVIDIEIPMMFDMASDASVRDPFFCMDDFELSTKDQDQAAIMVKDVKPAVELSSRHDQEQVGMMVKGVAPAVELSSGHMMPMVGMAMDPWWPMDELTICVLIKYALNGGCRHFDLTGDLLMSTYIGHALAEACQHGIVKREDLFISLKVCSDNIDNFIQAYKCTLVIRGLEYIDLGLVDNPLASKCPGTVFWHDLEQAVSLGLIRSIGLRNCDIAQIEGCLPLCNKINPAVNLVAVYPYMQHDALLDFCQKHGICIMAQYPMGGASFNDDPIINSLALKYSKTPKQLLLRWFFQRGIGVFFHLATALDTFKNLSDLSDFKISDNDMEAIKACNLGVLI